MFSGGSRGGDGWLIGGFFFGVCVLGGGSSGGSLVSLI